MKLFTSHRRVALAATAVIAALTLSACGGGGSADSAQLSFVGFAVPKAGNNAVQAEWAKSDAGKDVSWSESYGASGDQSRAVAGGLDADIVHFSLTPDITRLVDAGIVDETWDDGPNKGILTDTVVVLIVREGNPKGITGWDDLANPGVGIVTPNPGSSGSARWNILGAWQHVIANGGTEEDARAFMVKFFENVASLPGSARDATQAFQSGTGDVLISYENEAILARQQGEKLDYVVPSDTLLIENPAAVTTDADPKAQEFLDFALSAAGQAVYTTKGFRPLRSVEGVEIGEVEGATDPANPFPEITQLFTIDDDFGGWSEVNSKFFDENDGIITAVQHEVGLS